MTCPLNQRHSPVITGPKKSGRSILLMRVFQQPVKAGFAADNDVSPVCVVMSERL